MILGRIVSGVLALALFGCVSTRSTVGPVEKIADPTVSPSGSRVAFIAISKLPRSEDDSQWPHFKLLIVNLHDGSVIDSHTEADLGISPLAWSPDESKIAFPSARSPSRYQALQQLNVDRGNVRMIAHPECETPKYSPDGKFLGFVRLVRPVGTNFCGRGALKYDIVVESLSSKRRVVIENVDYPDWCWAKDGSGLFYIRDSAILSRNLQKNQADAVVKLDNADVVQDDIRHLVLSPHGHRLGYSYNIRDLVMSPDGHQLGYSIGLKPSLSGALRTDIAQAAPPTARWFHIVDLNTGRSQKLFESDHYYDDFQWNEAGILYLDRDGDERRKRGRLFLYDMKTNASRPVATGSISFFRWIDNSHMLYRKGADELWILYLTTGQERKVFPTDNQTKAEPIRSRQPTR